LALGRRGTRLILDRFGLTGGEALVVANNRIAADREAGCCNAG
jgi:hypothetical protein